MALLVAVGLADAAQASRVMGTIEREVGVREVTRHFADVLDTHASTWRRTGKHRTLPTYYDGNKHLPDGRDFTRNSLENLNHPFARSGGTHPPAWEHGIISGNGKLKFSNFHLSGIDWGDITLDAVEDGLRISGPETLHRHGVEFFSISYKVTALDGSMPILGASLELESHTSHHPFSKVFATKTVLGKGNSFFPELKFLKTYDIQDKFQKFYSEGDFHTPRDYAYVKDTVLLVSSGPTTKWIASTNRFPVVPEPGTASLLVLGLTGLVVAGRRRR